MGTIKYKVLVERQLSLLESLRPIPLCGVTEGNSFRALWTRMPSLLSVTLWTDYFELH